MTAGMKDPGMDDKVSTPLDVLLNDGCTTVWMAQTWSVISSHWGGLTSYPSKLTSHLRRGDSTYDLVKGFTAVILCSWLGFILRLHAQDENSVIRCDPLWGTITVY